MKMVSMVELRKGKRFSTPHHTGLFSGRERWKRQWEKKRKAKLFNIS